MTWQEVNALCLKRWTELQKPWRKTTEKNSYNFGDNEELVGGEGLEDPK